MPFGTVVVTFLKNVFLGSKCSLYMLTFNCKICCVVFLNLFESREEEHIAVKYYSLKMALKIFVEIFPGQNSMKLESSSKYLLPWRNKELSPPKISFFNEFLVPRQTSF